MANETLVAALDRLTGDVVKGKVPRKIKTGVNALDELLGGGIFLGPNLVFVSGESGCCASGLTFQAALNLASDGMRVLFFALESDERHAATRLVRSATGLDAYCQLDAAQRISFADSANALKDLPLELHAADSTTICMMNDAVKSALEELSEPLVIIVDGADYIARCDEAGLAASLKSIAIEWHVPIFCGVTSFDLDSFLNIALLCDEAVYLQNQGGGNVVMRLVKSRTRACRDAQSIETRFDAKTLTFGHDVGEKHAE